MKRLPGILAALLLIMSAFGACKLIVGPDTPAGNGGGGTLTISFGDGGSGGSRAVTSGAELPGEVLAGMRYELNLTGPDNETMGRSVNGGEALRETVKAGQWRIDAAGYYHDVLAGTGSVIVAVVPGDNAVRIPMMMRGPCYEVTVDPRIAHGTVRANFRMAFEGTPVTLTVTPDSDSVLKTESLTYNGSVIAGGPPYTFTLSGLDVTVGAEFIQFVRYVRAGGSGRGDGTSWANASGDLQGMMDELEAIPSSDYTGPRIVKVAAGTYKPQYAPTDAISANGTPGRTTMPSTIDRYSMFILRKGVQVWGGYPASGGDDASRNIAANETILSGDIDGDNTLSDNAYRVVLGIGVDRKTVLNGLTITGGNADGTTFDFFTVFTNKTVYSNSGGGIYTGIIDDSYSYSPVLVNVKISGNRASNAGGGMYNYNANPVLINVLVSGNTSGNRGGGIYNAYSSSPVFTNVTVSGNSSNSDGAVASESSLPITIRNSVIWGNNHDGVFDSYNTITVSNSIVQGGWTGAGSGNLNADPSFTAATAHSAAPVSGGDYRLNGGPAVNGGDNGGYPDTWAKWQALIGAGEGITSEAEYDMYIAPHLGRDLSGVRRKNGTIDMGAYEKQ